RSSEIALDTGTCREGKCLDLRPERRLEVQNAEPLLTRTRTRETVRVMIKLSDIHKYYRSGEQSLHVLKGIDLHIREGELVSIMGSSGSGKSTLLNILGVLDTYDRGNYVLAGHTVKNLKETEAAHLRNKLLGFVFQSFNLLPFKNATENRSEEHTSELQSRENLVCRLLLDTPSTQIYTLSLHDALPIFGQIDVT